MTVRDLKQLLVTLPDEFAIRIDCKSDAQEHIRSVSIEQGALVLRQKMLTIDKVIDTVTAFDGVEYVIGVTRVHYPTVIQMPHPVHSQIRQSLRKLGDTN